MAHFAQDIHGLRFPATVSALNELADDNNWTVQNLAFSASRTDMPNIEMEYTRVITTDGKDEVETVAVEFLGNTARLVKTSFLTNPISGYRARNVLEGILTSQP